MKTILRFCLLLCCLLFSVSMHSQVRDGEHKTVLIIGCSAEAFEGDRRRVMEVGCDAFLSKPIDRDELLVTLRSIL